MDEGRDYAAMTAQIVSAYLSANRMESSDIAGLIKSVHAALLEAAGGEQAERDSTPEPAVPIKKSVTDDFIICLEDGKKFKSLKRHLRTRYGMSPEEYRAKWRLPHDYPMVAPSYAKERSKLAKRMGLGQTRKAE